jgi:hypothetical protein
MLAASDFQECPARHFLLGTKSLTQPGLDLSPHQGWQTQLPSKQCTGEPFAKQSFRQTLRYAQNFTLGISAIACGKIFHMP